MYFGGASSRNGKGVGIVLKSPLSHVFKFVYRLEFEATNNVVEYEALLLGLNAAKDRGIRNIKVFGDADLIIQQVNKTFQAKHPRLKAYRDEVWRLKDSFDYLCISYIPRAKN